MRILSFLFLSILTLNALEIENFRTDLYSKNSPKILKKIELNLSLQGENLKENEIKIKDSLNTVISSFFL